MQRWFEYFYSNRKLPYPNKSLNIHTLDTQAGLLYFKYTIFLEDLIELSQYPGEGHLSKEGALLF